MLKITNFPHFRNYRILKIGLFRRVKELFKSNQTRHGVSPKYVESKTEKIFGIACLGKKLAFDTEIGYYFEYFFSKIEKFYRVKELFKVNQIDIPDYQYHLGCNAKRMARLAFLEKKFVFQSEISIYSLILFSKIEKFYRIKELFKVNQTDIPDYQNHLGCNTKRMARLALLEKSLFFNRKSRLFRLFYFQK